MVTLGSVVVAAKAIVSAPLPSETVILHLDSGIYYTVNEVGTRIWELLQQPVSLATVRDRLIAEYDVAADEAEADLVALIEELLARQLVELRETTPR